MSPRRLALELVALARQPAALLGEGDDQGGELVDAPAQVDRAEGDEDVAVWPLRFQFATR